MSAIAMMNVSLRESRMVLERLMQVVRVPEGLVVSLRDCALYSAALQLGGFPALKGNLQSLNGADPSRMKLADDRTLDAGGLHAWFVAEAVSDLAIAAARGGEADAVRVVNVMQSAELGVVSAFAHPHGFVATARGESSHAATITVQPLDAAAQAPLDRIRRQGLPVSAELWWELFHKSAAALATDTVESRRHAGPIIVAEDGRVVGRQDDDETDFSLLTSGAKAPLTNPAA